MTRKVGVKYEGNVVTNISVFDADDINSLRAAGSMGYELLESPWDNIVGTGWTKNDDGTFSDNRVVEVIQEPQPSAFDIAVSSGFDSGYGFRLALKDSDWAAFTALTTLIESGEKLGNINESTPVTIKDINGSFHQMTVSQYRQLIFAYGMYYVTLWMNKQ